MTPDSEFEEWAEKEAQGILEGIEGTISHNCLTESWLDFKNSITEALLEAYQAGHKSLDDEVMRVLRFYANNEGLRINHKTNMFQSCDYEDFKDFHGYRARELLQKLAPDKEKE